MLLIQTILHPTDFSERSQFAFRLACDLARDYLAPLIILHVANRPAPILSEGMVPPPSGDDNQALMEKLLRLQVTDPTVKVDHRLEEGNPATEIMRVAEQINADLIVMVTHGRRC